MENLETRLNEVARIAVRLEQETGCPAQLLIVQWAIESKWGERPVGGANYFGVKRAARHTKWCTITTREVVNGKSLVEDLEFADYDSLEDSCRDYAWLITSGSPYHAAWARLCAFAGRWGSKRPGTRRSFFRGRREGKQSDVGLFGPGGSGTHRCRSRTEAFRSGSRFDCLPEVGLRS